jgi:hypothetical protein
MIGTNVEIKMNKDPEFKAITLMRWIRKGIEDGTFIELY